MTRKISKKELFSIARGENRESFSKKTDRAQATPAESMASSQGVFELGVVEEVISDPYAYFGKPWPDEEETFNGQPFTIGDVYSGRVQRTDDKPGPPPVAGKKLRESPYKNRKMVDFAPPNSTKVFLKRSQKTSTSMESILCFPFFSSHLMLPVKPGETVWILKFSEEVYYWICRQTSFRQIEDVNYTFSQRESNLINHNLKGTDDEDVFAHFNSSGEAGPTNSIDYQDLIENSVSYQEEFTGEVVPRQAKGCGDFLIQGSNNSHIYLGKEKFEDSATVSPEIMTNMPSASDTLTDRNPLSPAVDICILRKSREIFELDDLTRANDTNSSQSVESVVGGAHASMGTGLGAVLGHKDNPRLGYYENEKSRDKLEKEHFFKEYFDSDIYNCIARIYMSNCQTIDDLLFTSDVPGEGSARPQDLLGLGNYGTLAMIGANTRVVGTETLKIRNIVGNAGIQINPRGDVIIHGNTAGGAKIVLEAEGGIRIIPGGPGIVKIGAEGANIAPVGGKPFNADESIADEAAAAVNDVSEFLGGTALLPEDFTIEPIATLNGSPLINPADIASGRTAPIPGFANYSTKVLIA